MLDHWLYAELGVKPRIFFDAHDVETGMSWPQKLAEGVASSKVMVCLWSREYFSSDWCKAELGLMMARCNKTSKPNNPLPLILAVIIHDGEDIPRKLDIIQQFPIQQYANPWICEGSPKAEQLAYEVRKLAKHIRHSIQCAPDYDPEWRDLARGELVSLFERRLSQSQPPSLGIIT